MTRSFVATGRIQPQYPTIEVVYYTSNPDWHPRVEGEEEIDHDLMRKIKIEEEIANG